MWALGALAIQIGLQLEAIAFVPLILVALLLFHRYVAVRPLLAGTVPLVGLFLLYVIYDARLGWPSLQAFLAYAREAPKVSADALRYALMLTSSAGIYGMAGSLYPQYLAGLPPLQWLDEVMMGLLVISAGYGVWQSFWGSGESRSGMRLLLIWLIIPVLLLTRHTAPVQPHYLILLYPVQFLLIAIFLTDMAARFPRPSFLFGGRRYSLVSLLIAGLCILWGYWQVAQIARLFTFMQQHPTTGGYGIPLRFTRAAAQEARRLAGSAEIIVLSTGVHPDEEETPAVFDALLFGHPHRFANGRISLPVPNASVVVYIAGPVPQHSSSELQPVLERLSSAACVRAGPAILLPDGWAYYLISAGLPGPGKPSAGIGALSGAHRF